MDKLRIIEIVLLAASAFISAAKSIVKLISYICKLNKKDAISI